MRRILLGALFVSAIIGAPLRAASAADLPVKAPAVVVPPITGPLWEGIYVGANFGGAWTHTTWCTDASFGGNPTCNTTPFDVVTQSPTGWIGGGQFGDRWQWGNLVAGLEATLEGVGASVTTSDPVFSGSRTTKFTGLYTFTGQAGWAFDRLLVYGKGGWASTRLSFQANTDTGGTLNASNFTDGWTVGAGLEYQVIPRLIVGVEYNYYRFDPKDFMSVTDTAGVTIPCAFCNFGSSTTMQTVMARVSIQAGPIPSPGY